MGVRLINPTQSDWTNNLINSWEIEWSECIEKENRFMLESIIRDSRPINHEVSRFNYCHSNVSGYSGELEDCSLCEANRVTEIPEDFQQLW